MFILVSHLICKHNELLVVNIMVLNEDYTIDAVAKLQMCGNMFSLVMYLVIV